MFNTRLRSLRMKYKYTQQNMADMLQISLNAYQKYEQAERSPSAAGSNQQPSWPSLSYPAPAAPFPSGKNLSNI